MSLFTSFNKPKPEKPVPGTAADMAYNMALDAIEGIKARRKAAYDAENNLQPSIETTAEDKERYEVLEALMKGRHRHIVVPLILEAFPELVTKETPQ